jgi:hypothetical protein
MRCHLTPPDASLFSGRQAALEEPQADGGLCGKAHL